LAFVLPVTEPGYIKEERKTENKGGDGEKTLKGFKGMRFRYGSPER